MEIGLNLDYGCLVQRPVEMERKGVLDSATIQYLLMVVVAVMEPILKTVIVILIVLKVLSDHENSSDSIAQDLFRNFSNYVKKHIIPFETTIVDVRLCAY